MFARGMRRRAGRITDAAAAAKLAQSATTCGALPASGTKAALPAADATTKTTERIVDGSDLRMSAAFHTYIDKESFPEKIHERHGPGDSHSQLHPSLDQDADIPHSYAIERPSPDAGPRRSRCST